MTIDLLSADLLTVGSGSIVGLVLGLVGGGGSILAVPLLVYLVGVSPPHKALGTSAIAVALTALISLMIQWRAGHVKWRCGAVFAIAGMVGALAGSSLAKIVPGAPLLALFGILMLVVGGTMLFRGESHGDADIHLDADTATRLLPRLMPLGLAVGFLSGFFGIGGGFLIVPGLMVATGMPMIYAAGTSLVVIFALGSTTAFNFALSGLVDWRLAGLFIVGGAFGGLVGTTIGKHFGGKSVLGKLFAVSVIIIGLWVVWQGAAALIETRAL